MSYSPTTWSAGDVITAAKMNKIEQGIVTAESSGSGGITTETDPTVPSWAKQSTKPSYNFSEIGSKPTTLSGYGITNAYTKTEVNNLISSGGSSSSGTEALIATCAYNSSLGAQALNKTVAEISDAITSGTPVYMSYRYGTDSSYIDEQALAPIVYVFRYGISPPEFRIMVAKPYNWGNMNSQSFIFVPSLLLFRAASASSYPVWFGEVHPTSGAFVFG